MFKYKNVTNTAYKCVFLQLVYDIGTYTQAAYHNLLCKVIQIRLVVVIVIYK